MPTHMTLDETIIKNAYLKNEKQEWLVPWRSGYF